jgi:hypothetical protein
MKNQSPCLKTSTGLSIKVHAYEFSGILAWSSRGPLNLNIPFILQVRKQGNPTVGTLTEGFGPEEALV